MGSTLGRGHLKAQRVRCHVGWPAGQRPDAGSADPPSASDGTAVVVATFPMPAGTRYDWHTHEDHQLAWAASGGLTVLTSDATWVLPPTRALWIPAGLPHETGSDGRATMRSLYIRPELSPVAWTQPPRVGPARCWPNSSATSAA